MSTLTMNRAKITTLEAIAMFTEEVTEKVGISEPYYDYGSSLGGAAWHAVRMARADG